MTTSPRQLHIYFTLDRSGSMSSMASDVIGGFNRFLADQQAEGDDALMTLIQFDSEQPHEVLADAATIGSVRPLSESTFIPRGGTPLYDAIGTTIARARQRERTRARGRLAAEEVLFVTFTDGQENQSREYDRSRVFSLVAERQDEGWSFLFLGANQDSYATGDSIGYTAGNVQNFAPDGRGARAAFESTSASISRVRASVRRGERYDKADLFGTDKAAERDLDERGGTWR